MMMKNRASLKMPNARSVQTETILMTTSLSFAVCVISVYIKGVLVWQKYLLKVGFAKFVQLLDLQESTYPVLSVTLKEVP